jgi:hypothetical protein
MIPYFEAARRDGWTHFVTGDKSRFFILSRRRRMWAQAKDKMATKVRATFKAQFYAHGHVEITWVSCH